MTLHRVRSTVIWPGRHLGDTWWGSSGGPRARRRLGRTGFTWSVMRSTSGLKQIVLQCIFLQCFRRPWKRSSARPNHTLTITSLPGRVGSARGVDCPVSLNGNACRRGLVLHPVSRRLRVDMAFRGPAAGVDAVGRLRGLYEALLAVRVYAALTVSQLNGRICVVVDASVTVHGVVVGSSCCRALCAPQAVLDRPDGRKPASGEGPRLQKGREHRQTGANNAYSAFDRAEARESVLRIQPMSCLGDLLDHDDPPEIPCEIGQVVGEHPAEVGADNAQNAASVAY